MLLVATMNTPRFIILVALFHMAGGRLYAQNLDDKRVNGVAFYKKHAFLPDTSVTVFEYRYLRVDGQTQFFTTKNGTGVKVTKNSDVYFVPYPGRGEADFEEASAAISTAQSRFPQYSILLNKIEHAWQVEKKRPPKLLHEEQQQSAKRRTALDTLVTFFTNLYNPQVAKSEFPAMATTLESPKATAKQEEASSTPSPNPLDLQKNIQNIQSYYQKAQELQ